MRDSLQSISTPFKLLIIALVLLLLSTYFHDIFMWVQMSLFFIGFFTIGIAHGAVDYILETGNLQTKIGFSFLLRYLSFAVIFFILWLIVPNFSIFFFLLFSALHFGQADMQEWNPANTHPMNNWAWGILVLGIILSSHVVETNSILMNMNVLLLPLNESDGEKIACSFVLIAIAWAWHKRIPAMFLSACLLAVGIKLPLLTSFGLYFIGQHSFNGWSHLKKAMNTNNLSLSLKALPFTTGAFILYLTMLLGLEMEWIVAFNKHWVTAFFVFISCISFPHVIAMHHFYKKYFTHTEISMSQ